MENAANSFYQLNWEVLILNRAGLNNVFEFFLEPGRTGTLLLSSNDARKFRLKKILPQFGKLPFTKKF